MDGDDLVEKVLTFGPRRSLVGIWTGPGRRVGTRPAVVMLNAGIIHRAGVSRLHVRLARVLAARGFHSLRFDLSGIGDSARRMDGDGGSSLSEQVSLDVAAALDQLSNQYCTDRFVLFGSCSGAHDALVHAVRDARVEGVIGLDLRSEFLNWRHHALHFRQRMFRVGSWWNALRGRSRLVMHLKERLGSRGVPPPNRRPEGFLSRGTIAREMLVDVLNGLLARDTRILLIFSGGLAHSYNHRSQFEEVFPEIARHPNLSSEFFPKADHMWTDRTEQVAAIDLTARWLDTTF